MKITDNEIPNLKQLEATHDSALFALAEACKPWEARRKALEAEQEAALEPYRTTLTNAENAIASARSNVWEQKRTAAYNACVNRIPSVDEFRTFCNSAARIKLGQGFDDYSFYGEDGDIKEIRAPKVKGLKIIALDGDRVKYYGAWSLDTGKLVGFFALKPSRHPGDVSEGRAMVNGQPVNFEEDQWSGLKTPLKAFVKTLADYSLTDFIN